MPRHYRMLRNDMTPPAELPARHRNPNNRRRVALRRHRRMINTTRILRNVIVAVESPIAAIHMNLHAHRHDERAPVRRSQLAARGIDALSPQLPDAAGVYVVENGLGAVDGHFQIIRRGDSVGDEDVVHISEIASAGGLQIVSVVGVGVRIDGVYADNNRVVVMDGG